MREIVARSAGASPEKIGRAATVVAVVVVALEAIVSVRGWVSHGMLPDKLSNQLTAH